MNKEGPSVQPSGAPQPTSQYQLYPHVDIPNTSLLLLEVVQFQRLLNIQLLRNQCYVESFLAAKTEINASKNAQSGTSCTSEGAHVLNKRQRTDRNQAHVKVKQEQDPIKYAAIRQQSPPHKKKCSQKHSGVSPSDSQIQESSYNPKHERRQKKKQSPGFSSQSKNTPKNISKSIFLFIQRNPDKLSGLFKAHNIDKAEFLAQVAHLKGNIHAISQLRSLWLDEQNQYARMYRIIGNLYLRKYSLQHIFNSRVVGYGKHLKYRNRVLGALSKPWMLTRLKEY